MHTSTIIAISCLAPRLHVWLPSNIAGRIRKHVLFSALTTTQPLLLLTTALHLPMKCRVYPLEP